MGEILAKNVENRRVPLLIAIYLLLFVSFLFQRVDGARLIGSLHNGILYGQSFVVKYFPPLEFVRSRQ
jgi:hypothetical protein